jgi:hypothetical protein
MLESGQALSARFVLVRPLGAGGAATVWLAQDRERDCHVALKFLRPELARDPEALATLQNECERIQALDHPNILRVHGSYRSADLAWIAMEYAAGGDLSQWRGRPWAEILRVTIPIANALACANAAGVVHRDVKSGNVLLTSDGTPKLADFGMALAVNSVAGPSAGLGSPYSMSPQQLDGSPAAPADDIYAFGVMLYELLSGYPPFYPRPTPQRIRAERAPRLELPGMPAALTELIERCLAKSPLDRPSDMKEVEQQLKASQAELPPTASKADGAAASPRIEPPPIRPPSYGEPLRGEWRRTTSSTPSEEELRRQGFRRGLTAALFVVGLLSVGIVFFALPRWVGDPTQASVPKPDASAPAVPTQAASEPEQKEVEFAELARAKQEAEDRRAALDDRLEKLRARAVEQWGGEDYRRVVDELAATDKEFEAREYVAAAQRLASIEPILDTLEQNASKVLTAQLETGAVALRDGRSEDAQAAFGLAAKIDPGNAVAARGLKRAATLDEVLALVAQAERHEKENQLSAAAETFRKALALDSEAPRASDGLARVQARVAGDAFATAMAQGFAALAKSDYASARSAFESAGKIRPGSAEVQQALSQVEQEQRTRVIAAKLDSAQALEAKERWADALAEYRAVLDLDSTVAAAKQGVERTTPRAKLNEELELYLTQPERLFSQPVRTAARETLSRASAVRDAGPVLRQQIATLSDWLARAEVPVRVALQSDNLTQVTIFRVGQLGAFTERSLELAPGTYTVLGTRPGYRDVRREITVTPGAALPPVVIRCEEKI